MKLFLVMVSILTATTIIALHVDFSSEKKIDFAHKRIAMIKAMQIAKNSEIIGLKKTINEVKQNIQQSDKLALLLARLAQLKNELAQLQTSIDIAENSIKALK